MGTPLDGFLELRPAFTQCVPVAEADDLAIHLAAWKCSAFRRFQDFIAFVFRYSSALQPYVAEPDRRDLAQWVHIDQDSESHVKEFLQASPVRQVDARSWFRMNGPAVDVSFLDGPAMPKGVLLEDAAYLQTHDWYVHAFVADLLTAPEPYLPPPGHDHDEPWSEDRQFYEQLGAEDEARTCGQNDCRRGAVRFSVFCRPHHFESVKGKPSPYSH